MMESMFTEEALPVRTGRVIQRLALGVISPPVASLDWHEVAGVAISAIGSAQAETSVPPDVVAEFEVHVQEAAVAVADFTGLVPLGPLPRPVVFNRAEWIVTTVQTMGPLIEPFVQELKAGRRLGSRLMKTAVRAELGLVVAYLSRRVLGQFDISLIEPAAHEGRLFFIYPNIIEAESKLGVDESEFRRWLALHETTHVFQFKATTWLRPYISHLLSEQLKYLQTRLSEEGRNQNSRLTVGSLLVPGGLSKIMSVDENPNLAKMQALMSVLEGYSEFVMERVAAARGEGSQNIAEMFDHARRTQRLGHKIIERVIGLQVKIDQYRLGYQFINEVASAADMALVNRVWEGPEKLPTLTELHRPALWISRMLKN